MSATLVDDTVQRRARPWTPAVRALLRHFERVGLLNLAWLEEQRPELVP